MNIGHRLGHGCVYEHDGFVSVRAVYCGIGVWSLQSAPRTAALYHYLVFLQVLLEPNASATPILETLARCASGYRTDAVPFFSCHASGKA